MDKNIIVKKCRDNFNNESGNNFDLKIFFPDFLCGEGVYFAHESLIISIGIQCLYVTTRKVGIH